MVESAFFTAQPVPLLATRFFSPPLPPTCVTRPRLLERLERGLLAPAILVSAPPGFGKSSLLSEWIHHREKLKSGWLSLEPSDRDWGLFFRYLIAAWQRVFPQAGEAALAGLNAPSPDREMLANLLLNDLLAGQETLGASHALLVLDDYHRIETPAIHATVAYLIEHLPPRCHLVLLTRADPPLPTARWRAHGLVLELRADDLRFTSDEAALFLNRVMGLDLRADQIDVLEARTEGWIVGLQMAALSLQGRANAQTFVSDFGGSNRFVLDYLVEEVLQRQPAEIQHFLLSTAPLEKFCADLCDTLLETPSPSSQAILERLEKANLFLIPLDDQRRWYRYHHLFADLLQVRLVQTDPDRTTSIYSRAATWFSQNSLWREAILYALKAGNYALGESLFIAAILADELHFLYSPMQPFVDLFPAAWVQSRPLLSLAKALYFIQEGQMAGVEPLLRFAECGIKTAPPFEGQERILALIYVVSCNAASILGDSQWIIEASRQVERMMPQSTEAMVDTLLQMGVAFYYEGKLNQIDAIWGKSLSLSEANHFTFYVLCVQEAIGRILCHQGKLQQAEAIFQKNQQLITEEKGHYLRWLGATLRDYSDLLRERNRLDEARKMIDTSLPLCEKWEAFSGTGLGYLHYGRLLLAMHDLPGAHAMLHKAEGIRRMHSIYPDLETLIQIFQSTLLLANDELAQAWEVLETCQQAPYAQHPYHREWVLTAQARVLIRMGRPQEALDILAGWLEDAHENGRGRNWLEMSLLTALALKDTGDLDAALQVLAAALEFACPQGFIRIFVDEGESLRRLLEEFHHRFPSSPHASYVADLLAIFPAQTTPEPGLPSALSGLVEPLSEREEEVFALVCQGLSNSEIAARLVLSVGTVKTHIHTIYGKLGVRDRPQAIALARDAHPLTPTLSRLPYGRAQRRERGRTPPRERAGMSVIGKGRVEGD